MVKLFGDSISPQAAHALLWNLGHRYGVALGKKAVQATANTEEAVKMLSYAAFRSGWGLNNVINRLQQDNVVEVILKTVFSATSRQTFKAPTCYFLAGVLGGIAEAVYGKRFESRETECRAVRGSVCRFLLRPL
jgi:predicted hydrocarbon binding protein